MIGYDAGMLDTRVTVHIPGQNIDTEYGRKQLPGNTIQRWAAVDWNRGTKSLREGVIDAYDTIMVRMRYDQQITRDCKLEINGTMYSIQSFHSSYKEGKIQITATEIVG